MQYLASKIKPTNPFLIGIILTAAIFGVYATTLNKRDNSKLLYEQKDAERSIVLLNNRSAMIPLQSLDTRKIASVNMGSVYAGVFDSLLSKYAFIKSFSAESYKLQSLTLDDLTDDLKFYNTIIIQVIDESFNDPEVLRFILENQKNKKIILAGFGDFSVLKKLNQVVAPIVWSPDYNTVTSWYSAQLIFGGTEAKGKLSKTISSKYKAGSGYRTKKIRLKYTIPEEAGIHSSDLSEIDSIAAEAIREKATPSVVVMAIKDGRVIFNKAYGSHTYEGKQPTKVSDIYDLASITKISATTMAVMRLYEQKKLKLDTNVGAYIPKARKTDKNNISVREVMLHQAGFVSYIPFYKKLTPDVFRTDSSYAFPVKAADGYFIRRDYFKDVMWPEML
ncbi:MAG TPA: serine hydrolase domain-containing protein, partial [Sphingobacteriaceae bacterium]